MRLVLRPWSMMAYAAFETWLVFFLFLFFLRLETEYLKKGARGRGGKKLHMSVEKRRRLLMGGAGLEGGKGGYGV